MNQHIRFCKSFDGTRIAYAVTGRGPVLIKAPYWFEAPRTLGRQSRLSRVVLSPA
jgi:hypothetical protein